MPTVLILENDPLSRVHYLRALSGLPSACVVASSSEPEAQTLVSAITPDVVVADVRWLQQDHLDWLARGTERPGPSVIAIQEPSKHSLNSANFRVIACLSKPVDATELRRAVQDQLVKSTPDLWFGLTAYIKLVCEERRSLQLAFTSNQGSGVVTIEQGQVWAASYNGTSGFAAFAQALRNPNTHVALWPPLVGPCAREIAGDWPMLLASAAQYWDGALNEDSTIRPHERDLDFSDVLAPTIVPVSTVIESGQKLRTGRGGYESLIVDAVAACIERRYTDAIELFEEASGLVPDGRAVRSRVAWLKSLVQSTLVGKDAQS